MVLFADEERDERKEVDSNGGGEGTKKKGKKMKRPTGRRGERLEDVEEKRGNEKEMKKRTERDGLSSFAYLLHYSE